MGKKVLQFEMMNTSLQNIISGQSSSLHDSEVKLLFQRKQHPSFQLSDFHRHSELLPNQQFLFFLKILEKWNQQVAGGQELSECAFARHEFIFSWLKSLAVLSREQVKPALQQLFDWYNSTRTTEPHFLIRKEVPNKSHLQEWEIRNSYKSNLPLEIDSYKRRLLVHPGNDRPIRTADHSPPDKENQASQWQRQNALIKGQRQQEEVRSYLSNYHKSKVYFYKNIPKDYYRNEFERDKLATSDGFYRSNKQQRFFPTDDIKSYRIKTTAGARPYANRSLAKTPLSQSLLHQKELGEEEFRLMPTNINGMGLMGNPFQVKLRKKKKK